MSDSPVEFIELSDKKTNEIPRQTIPRTWKRLVDWFELGKIPDGDPKRPSRLFHPYEVEEHAHLAVVIDGQLKYQEPEEPVKSYGPEIDKMLGLR